MASISTVGVGSGVLTSELIDKLVAVEREVGDKRLDSQEELATAKISGLGTISSLAETLRNSVSALTLSSSFQTNIASSTNDSALTATASSIATAGVYTIETTKLARSQSLATTQFSSLDAVVGEGVLNFTFGDVNYDSIAPSFSFTPDAEAPTRAITIDASNHTIGGIRDAINDAGIGVRASIIDTGNGYRLLFESEDAGSNNGFTLTVDNSSNGLDSLNFNDASTTMLQTVAASDSAFKINGLTITRESNQVAGVIAGVTLNLRAEGGGPITLSVEPDTSTITTRMQTFVDSYNELKTTINELTAFDTDTSTGSLFTGDSTVRSLVSTSQRILGQFISQLDGGSFRTLSEVGIETNSKTGELSFDLTTFQTALSENAKGLTTMFGTMGSATDKKVEFVSGASATQTGDYDVVVTQLAAQAQYIGMSTSGGPFVIDSSNDGFRISVDGTLSDNVVMPQGTYTAEQVADILQNSINSDARISDAGHSVDVLYNTTEQRFEITSSSYGSTSSVGFVNVDANSSLTLGLGTSSSGAHFGSTVTALTTSSALTGSVVVNGGNDQFSLSVDGVTSNIIKIGNGSYSNGDTLATAIETAINDDVAFKLQGIVATVKFSADELKGGFDVSFSRGTQSGLGFTALTADSGMTSTLGLSAGGSAFSPVVGLDVTDTLATTLNNTAQFVIEANGVTSSTISVAINSNDGSTIAAAIQAAIQTDANFIGASKPAETAAGSVDISAGTMNFTTTPRALGLEYNGTRYDVLINANAVAGSDIDGDGNTDFIDDTLQAVQDVIDATAGLAGNVIVDRNGTGLTFKTVASGINQTLNVIADGSGSKTILGGVGITGTENFSTNPTNFTLTVDSTEFDIALDGDFSLANNSAQVLAHIQSKIDTELSATTGFQAGDIVARLDSGKLYFQTVSKDGVATTETIGTGSSIRVNVGATDPLGLLPPAGVYSAGSDGYGALDGFGHTPGMVKGQDLTQVTVTYEGGTEGGRFKINFGNDVNFHVKSPNGFSESSLGLVATTNASFGYAYGKNVQGTIDGKVAIGIGQRLTGATGSAAEGLRINVTGGNLGYRGEVSYSRGVAQQLTTFLDDFLDDTGSLGVRQTGLQNELADIAEKRVALDDRIEKFKNRLTSQFSFNDAIIKQLNTTQDFLTQQFDILSAALTNKN